MRSNLSNLKHGAVADDLYGRAARLRPEHLGHVSPGLPCPTFEHLCEGCHHPTQRDNRGWGVGGVSYDDQRHLLHKNIFYSFSRILFGATPSFVEDKAYSSSREGESTRPVCFLAA